jgi:hypothetical protein
MTVMVTGLNSILAGSQEISLLIHTRVFGQGKKVGMGQTAYHVIICMDVMVDLGNFSKQEQARQIMACIDTSDR